MAQTETNATTVLKFTATAATATFVEHPGFRSLVQHRLRVTLHVIFPSPCGKIQGKALQENHDSLHIRNNLLSS